MLFNALAKLYSHKRIYERLDYAIVKIHINRPFYKVKIVI